MITISIILRDLGQILTPRCGLQTLLGRGDHHAQGQKGVRSLTHGQLIILLWAVNSIGEPFGQLVRNDGLIESGACDNDQGTPDGARWVNYTQNQGSAVALSQAQWENVKFRLELNSLGSSDGIFQLWINDVLKADYSNMNFRGQYSDYGWNHLMMSFDQSTDGPLEYVARDSILIENESTSAKIFIGNGILTIKEGAVINVY